MLCLKRANKLPSSEMRVRSFRCEPRLKRETSKTHQLKAVFKTWYSCRKTSIIETCYQTLNIAMAMMIPT